MALVAVSAKLVSQVRGAVVHDASVARPASAIRSTVLAARDPGENSTAASFFLTPLVNEPAVWVGVPHGPLL